jgi:hypothetical protein
VRNGRRPPRAAASDVRNRTERCTRTEAVNWRMIAVLGVTILTAWTASPLGARAAAGAARADGGSGAGGGARSNAAAWDGAPRHALSAGPQRMQTESASVAVSGEVEGTADFEVGDTYTQQSHLAQGGQPSAVGSAKRLLSSMGTFQNVSLMGWGTQDPEPVPGSYSWGSLDSRIEVMAATVPPDKRMITLCSAPGWMKVGGSNQEWNMETAVAPSQYQDFAHLAAEVAERYDGQHRTRSGEVLPKVDYFDVWNEMKGFWDTATNSWDVQAYTTLYNDVYAAIKAVRPDARIGGPYAPLAATDSLTADASPVHGSFGSVDQRDLDVITYWLAHKTGAQFVSMDGGPASTDESDFASGRYFAAVAHWLRTLDNTAYPGAASLPIMWAEFYPGIRSTSGTAAGQEAVAVDVSNVVAAGQAGVDYLLIWEMEGNAAGMSPYTGESVWTDTADVDGGRPTALYRALSELADAFPPRTTLYRSTVKGPVAALAGAHGVLVVSESAHDLVVSVNGAKMMLGPYGVTVTHRPGQAGASMSGGQ